MNDNGPISVSAPGTSLTTASGADVTFNTRYPFAKLDSTNDVSFQVLTIFFNTEPPNPPTPPSGGSTENKTLIYSMPHGYSYIPSTWFLLSGNNFDLVDGSEGYWLYGSATGIGLAQAKFEIEVDAKNINFYVEKVWPSIATNPPDIIGQFVNIRCYVFAEDLSGNNVPNHA